MVTLTSADNALKSVYLGVVANQLNINANPLLGKIKQSTQDVWGKEIIKLAPYGINGGIGAGNETDQLPFMLVPQVVNSPYTSYSSNSSGETSKTSSSKLPVPSSSQKDKL